ncbi:hypothetical protein B4Q13_16380, partial [Lacticaseibacillus rhamnosus]
FEVDSTPSQVKSSGFWNVLNSAIEPLNGTWAGPAFEHGTGRWPPIIGVPFAVVVEIDKRNLDEIGCGVELDPSIQVVHFSGFQHLAELQKLCSPIPCEEYKELKRAVEEYKKNSK